MNDKIRLFTPGPVTMSARTLAIGSGMASKQKKKNKTADSSSEDTNYRFSS